MDEHVAQLQSCMYQYSRAIYRSVKDLIDPYADEQTRLEHSDVDRAWRAATTRQTGGL